MAVFDLEHIEVVYAPVPAGYDYGQTHSGIEFIPGGFLGYSHWLSASPYANYNLDWENPCVYYANERTGNIPPVEFTPHIANPLQIRPPATNYYEPFNSDPDIFFDTNKIIVLNRICNGHDVEKNLNTADIINCQEITSLDAVSNPVTLYSHFEAGWIGSKFGVLSPALLKINDKYRIYHLSSSGGSVNVKCFSISLMESDSLTRNFKRLNNGSIWGNNIEPWHMDVFTYNNKFYAIVNAADWNDGAKNKQYLAESSNGFDFKIYPTPLIDYNSYRGSAYVREDGLFVLYSTVIEPSLAVHSVDGREIILCYQDFNTVLNQVKS